MVLGCFFFFNDTATTEIYTLSLHDALPISTSAMPRAQCQKAFEMGAEAASGSGVLSTSSQRPKRTLIDRKSTRLNSSHANISYAVFCLKKKTRTLREYSVCT